MAKRSGSTSKTTPASATTPAPLTVDVGAIVIPTIPAAPANLNALVKRITWPKADIIHRIHPTKYKDVQFNPGPHGNARFSPISNAAGAAIPTIYGGTSFDCAAMETVFHDVPFAAGLKSVRKSKIRGHHYSNVLPATDLVLADLSSTALRNLGIKRRELIESEKDVYPQTRDWAEAIHAQCPDVQGLCWISKQDDTARAIVLFEDRMPSLLTSAAASLDLVTDIATYANLVTLARTIGVKITGK
jgi:hypothetical protein